MLSEQNLFFALAAVIWAVLLFGGFVFGKPTTDHARRMPRWTRMASSFTLVIVAWCVVIFSNNNNTHHPAHTWFAVGMTLGFIGDLFMARLILKGDNFIIGGIGAFALGHIAYINAMSQLADPTVTPVWAALGAWLIAGAIGWAVVVFPVVPRTIVHYAALPYTLLLAATPGVATALALSNQPNQSVFVIIALGGALFLASDFLIALEIFRKFHFRWINDWIWFTYGPAQALIVYSVILQGMHWIGEHIPVYRGI